MIIQQYHVCTMLWQLHIARYLRISLLANKHTNLFIKQSTSRLTINLLVVLLKRNIIIPRGQKYVAASGFFYRGRTGGEEAKSYRKGAHISLHKFCLQACLYEQGIMRSFENFWIQPSIHLCSGFNKSINLIVDLFCVT